MGNRCIVKPIDSNIGVYLHWNGGRSSVTAFLEYCKLKEYRPFGGKYNDGYGIARFCQIVGNWFGGGLSLGIQTDVEATEEYADGLDNGIFIVDGWDIVDHIGNEDKDNYDLTEFLISIDEAQPKKEQLGKDYIMGELVDALDIEIGDTVGVLDLEGECKKFKVIDRSTPHYNEPTIGYPVIDMYENHGGEINPNNILRGKVRRLAPNTENENKEENTNATE